MTAIAAWHAYAKSPHPAALHALLDPDVTFDSPVVHTTQHGRAITAAYLAAAMTILGTADFRYTGEWRSATGAVLEFETVIDGIAVNGVDIIRLTDDRQRIAAFGLPTLILMEGGYAVEALGPNVASFLSGFSRR